MKVRKKYGFMASGAALSQAWDFNWVSLPNVGTQSGNWEMLGDIKESKWN